MGVEVQPDTVARARAALVDASGQETMRDTRRPIFHVQASSGWSSDPCGPIHYKGQYHMFFQHLRRGCTWNWGLCWDHVVSSDLVHWRKVAPAVCPTPGWYDADGCFTGAIEIDPDTGLPVILYTGVYLKANRECEQLGLPPPEYDTGLRFVETLLAAVPEDADDPDLVRWRKLEHPILRYPPPQSKVPITCWRDPHCVERGDNKGKEWVMLMASGIKGKGGAVLVFRCAKLLEGWRFDGLLASAHTTELGTDWECPMLARLNPMPSNPKDLLPAVVAAPAGTAGPFGKVLGPVGFEEGEQELELEDGRVLVSEASFKEGLRVLIKEPGSARASLDKDGSAGEAGRVAGRSSIGARDTAEVADAAAANGKGAGKDAGVKGDDAKGDEEYEGPSTPQPRSPTQHTGARSSPGSEASSFYAASQAAGSMAPSVGSLSSCSLAGMADGDGAGGSGESAAAKVGDAADEAVDMPITAADKLGAPAPGQVPFSSSLAALVLPEDEEASFGGIIASSSLATTPQGGSRPLQGSSSGRRSGDLARSSSLPAGPIENGFGNTLDEQERATLAEHAEMQMNAAAEAFSMRHARIAAPILTPIGTPRGGTPWDTPRCADGCLPAGPLENGYELSLTDEERANLEAAEAAALSGQFALQQAAQQEEQEFVELEADDWAEVMAAKSAAGMAELASVAAAAAPGGEAEAAATLVAEEGAPHVTADDGKPMWKPLVDPATYVVDAGDGTKGGDWFFAISPDACINPIFYWLGKAEDARFDTSKARGPFKFDLGKTLYAATMYEDPLGRHLVIGWVQDHRRVPSPPCLCEDYDYAGCISTPRALYLDGAGHVHQSPLPELNLLRTDVSWKQEDLLLQPHAPPLPLPAVSGVHLDIEVTFLPPEGVVTGASNGVTNGVTSDTDGSPNPRVGLLLKSWRPNGRGAAVVTFDWVTRELEVVFDEPLPNAYDPNPDPTVPGANRVGGKLRAARTPDEPLELRLLMDGSCLEIFTGAGEALTTRVYRGEPPALPAQRSAALALAQTARDVVHALTEQSPDGAVPGGVIGVTSDTVSEGVVAAVTPSVSPAGVELFAAGAACRMARLAAWEMGSCWVGGGMGGLGEETVPRATMAPDLARMALE